MSTATVTPTAEVVTGAPASTQPVTLTPAAIDEGQGDYGDSGSGSCWAADWRGWRRMLGFPVLDVV